MKGYIYTMFQGADPGAGWHMTDPIYSPVPTLGACMPNIRRAVKKGDYIFSISGRVKGVKQYIVGGLQVDEKIDALSAYSRFPENRMVQIEDGLVRGNIIFDGTGNHLPFDYHANHEKRIENYIVGTNPIFLENENQIEIGRQQTIGILNDLFGKNGNSVKEVVGRWRRLDENQINRLVSWMSNIKRAT